VPTANGVALVADMTVSLPENSEFLFQDKFPASRSLALLEILNLCQGNSVLGASDITLSPDASRPIWNCKGMLYFSPDLAQKKNM